MKKKQLIVLFIFIGINLILLLLIYRINNYNRILIDELVLIMFCKSSSFIGSFK